MDEVIVGFKNDFTIDIFLVRNNIEHLLGVAPGGNKPLGMLRAYEDGDINQSALEGLVAVLVDHITK